MFTTAPNHNNSCYPTLLLNNLTFTYHYIIEITNFLESLPFWCFLSAIILQPIYDSHYQANMHIFERNLISIKICFGTSYNFPRYKYERTYSVRDIIQEVQRHSKIFFVLSTRPHLTEIFYVLLTLFIYSKVNILCSICYILSNNLIK